MGKSAGHPVEKVEVRVISDELEELERRRQAAGKDEGAPPGWVRP
jgi:hypothetical protein